MAMIEGFRETEDKKREGGVSSHVLPLRSDDFLNRARNDWRQDM